MQFAAEEGTEAYLLCSQIRLPEVSYSQLGLTFDRLARRSAK
jgi:hypothetical protein